MDQIKKLTTELRNPNTTEIDTLSTLEMVKLINNEDKQTIEAVYSVKEDIANAIDIVYEAINSGGRLIYMGAGTSGRLGVLDASELTPTYGVGEESVIGVIAGGDSALRNAIEGAEDFESYAVEDLKKLKLTKNDVVCAIASSGRTPYCIGALKYAKELGAQTIAIANVKDSIIGTYAQTVIEAVSGPEVVAGSTRMKAGTVQKMILNIISTATMIKYGKVYGNLMIDVNASNEKLVLRAHSIIQEATGCSEARAIELLEQSDKSVKVAIVMELMDLDQEDAQTLLKVHKGRIRDAIRD
ncbi:MAG: N-acetylmuramic acid 6-phosphate etherase [Erysipelothrix sp.]|nr:N-acetylmuramic acid 6-phosphate etherase [Erysipelothrix sp.]